MRVVIEKKRSTSVHKGTLERGASRTSAPQPARTRQRGFPQCQLPDAHTQWPKLL